MKKHYALLSLAIVLLLFAGCMRLAPSTLFPSIARSEAAKEIAADKAKEERYNTSAHGQELRRQRMDANQADFLSNRGQTQLKKTLGFPVIFPNYSDNDLVAKVTSEDGAEAWDLGVIKSGDLTTSALLEDGIYKICWNVVGSDLVYHGLFKVSSLPDFHIKINGEDHDYYGSFRFYGGDNYHGSRNFFGHSFRSPY